MDAVWARLGVNAECSDLNGPHQRLKEGCEARGLELRPVTRNTDPATYDAVTAGYMGYGDAVGLEELDPEDVPRGRGRARRRVRRPLPSRADPGRGRPGDRRRVQLRRSGRAEGQGHGPGAAGRRRLRRDRVAGIAAAVRDRRARRRRLSPAAPDHGDLRGLRGTAGPLVGPTAGRYLPRLRESRATATASCSSAPTTRPGCSARRCPGSRAAAHKEEILKYRVRRRDHQPDPRPGPRPGDDRRPRPRGSELRGQRSSSTSPTSAVASRR